MSVTVLAIVMCIGLPSGLAFIAWFTDSGRDLRRRLSHADYHWLAVGLVLAQATAVEAQLLPAA